MVWTEFWDMSSGGGHKEEFHYCHIEAPEEEAKRWVAVFCLSLRVISSQKKGKESYLSKGTFGWTNTDIEKEINTCKTLMITLETRRKTCEMRWQ